MPSLLRYPVCVGLALLAYFALSGIDFPHPDSSYLRARYAQNLANGDGFGYNPDEPILLTSAPLPILIHTASSLGEVESPPELLTFILIGLGSAALLGVAHPIALIPWLAAAVVTFGGLELWLVVLALLALEASQHDHWYLASLLAGLMLLIAPLAIIFVILLGIEAVRQNRLYWPLVFIPAAIGLIVAAMTYDLRGLLLPAVENETPALGVYAMFVVAALIVLWQSEKRMLLLFGLGYFVLAGLLGLTFDLTLIVTGLVIGASLPQGLMIGAVTLVGVVLAQGLHPTATDWPDFEGTVGHVGSNREAFEIGGTVYHLGGLRDPELFLLSQADDASGILIATAPDFVIASPPADGIAYTTIEDAIWQRQAATAAWNAPDDVDLDYGPDLILTRIANSDVAELLRLQLEWELPNTFPIDDMEVQVALLDSNQAVVGGMQQRYPMDKWQAEQVTTYHALAVADDLPPGEYVINITAGYRAGIIDRRNVATLKIAPTRTSDAPPIARFDDGNQAAEVLEANLEVNDDQLNVVMVWRVVGDFATDYTVFVHLTPPDEPFPIQQGDRMPAYPTRLWESGEIVEETFTVNLAEVPAGQYVLRVGFFHPELGRIPLADGGDALNLPIDITGD